MALQITVAVKIEDPSGIPLVYEQQVSTSVNPRVGSGDAEHVTASALVDRMVDRVVDDAKEHLGQLIVEGAP